MDGQTDGWMHAYTWLNSNWTCNHFYTRRNLDISLTDPASVLVTLQTSEVTVNQAHWSRTMWS